MRAKSSGGTIFMAFSHQCGKKFDILADYAIFFAG